MNWNSYIKNYQSYLKIERGLSKNSVESYVMDVEKLNNYLIENNIQTSPISIKEETVQEFIYFVSKDINPRSD